MVYEDEIWDNQLGDKLVIDGQTSLCSWTNVYARWEDLLQVLARSPDVEPHCQRDDSFSAFSGARRPGIIVKNVKLSSS